MMMMLARMGRGLVRRLSEDLVELPEGKLLPLHEDDDHDDGDDDDDHDDHDEDPDDGHHGHDDHDDHDDEVKEDNARLLESNWNKLKFQN